MECAVCFDVFGGAQECAPRSQSKAGADRNPPHAEIGQLGKRKLVIESGDEDIDMLGSDCLHDLRNFIWFTDGRRVDAIGTGFGVRNEPVEGGIERIGIVHQPRFATAG